MDRLYDFMDRYIVDEFREEKQLKASPRGTVTKVRQKSSHRIYICRRYNETMQIYLDLVGKRCLNLPQIYEAATEPATGNGRGRMVVLEEYIAGDTLSTLLQCGALTSSQARSISIQLCRALYVLHGMGWVHRDIKPENVIMLGDRAVLIDCDAARHHSTEKTRDTRVLGTVGYAPPEQFGISETDYRADIYAMGVLMNEMLTGDHPSRTLAKGRWGRIIMKCTMIQPDKRYHSVRELMEVL